MASSAVNTVGQESVGFLKRFLRKIPCLRFAARFILYKILGHRDEHWLRVVMNRETSKLIAALNTSSLDVLEISGGNWLDRAPFRTYQGVSLPDFDICKDVLPKQFDLIVAEQVFEHLCYPYRAAKNVYKMLRPGGYFLVTTPFLVKIHNYPIDCSRWTEAGMKYFLEECGFEFASIQAGSWGNRSCMRANFTSWVYYNTRLHSLENEPDFPLAVWALARK